MDPINNKTESELKEALEYQIDIVLRLEEERLLLLKENKIQKQKIKELSDMLTKYTVDSLKACADQSCQTDAEEWRQDSLKVDFATQTDQVEEPVALNQNLNPCTSTCKTELDSSFKSLENLMENESLLQYSKDKEDSIINQAQSLLNKHSSEKTSTTQKSVKKSQLPIKELKFKKKDKENNNTQQTIATEKCEQILEAQPKLSEKEIIAQELMKLTKEYNQIKKEVKKQEEAMKKKDKDHQDLKKQMDVKNEMLNKLRTEVAELSLLINNDKFKSIKLMENDLKKMKADYQVLKKEHLSKCEEKMQLETELQQFKTILEKLTQEYNRVQNNEGGQAYLQKENQQYKAQIEELERKLSFKSKEVSIKEQSCEEMMLQCRKLNEEIDYFKQLSKTSKEHAEKALEDIEFYRSLLKKNNITLR